MDIAKVISLCTGYGGIEIGLSMASLPYESIAMVEREAFAISNLVDKMEKAIIRPTPIWTDVTTFPASKFRRKVDFLVGGLPCQPVSCAGKRKGAKDERWLWDDALRIIEDCQPTMCFFENVQGFITKGLRDVLIGLEQRGYKTTWGIFSAAEVGAPHERKRVFVLANTNSVNGRIHAERWFNNIQTRSAGEVADINTRRQQEQWGDRLSQKTYSLHKHLGWPAPPNRKQYEWEPLRVTEGGVLNPDWVECLMGLPVGWTDEGTKGNRVDRLRLLGNGVVPQTAALAFETLLPEVVGNVSEENFKDIVEETL